MEKEENQPRYEADDLREAVEVLKKGESYSIPPTRSGESDATPPTQKR